MNDDFHGIVLEHLGGPAPVRQTSDSQELRFGRDKTDIRFGRFPHNDVVLDEKAVKFGVGREHCRIHRWETGRYTLEMTGRHKVEINGKSAGDGWEIPDQGLVRLGTQGGPEFRVCLFGQESEQQLTPTEHLHPPEGRINNRLKRTAQTSVGALAVAVIGVGAVAYYSHRSETNFEAAISEFREDFRAAAEESFQRRGDVVERMRASAYAVVLDDGEGNLKIIGTAWPVGKEGDGYLATNAHVAQEFRPGRMRVVSPDADAEHQVESRLIHPGYAAYKEFRSKALEDDPDFRRIYGPHLRALPSAYDVALLSVDRPGELAPPLPLAPVGDVAAGDYLGAVGYPIENSPLQEMTTTLPPPQAKFGHLASVTDYFLLGAEDEYAYLIRHSIPAFGGASGSAIFDRNGNVVALLSGGCVFEAAGGRQPCALQDNYAQRADLLRAILPPVKSFDLDREVQYWTTGVLPKFRAHRQSVRDATLDRLTRSSKDSAVEIATIEGSLANGTQTAANRYCPNTIELTAGAQYSFLAYGEPDEIVTIALFRYNEPLGLSRAHFAYAAIDGFVPEDTGEFQVYVAAGSDSTTSYELFAFGSGDLPSTEQSMQSGC